MHTMLNKNGEARMVPQLIEEGMLDCRIPVWIISGSFEPQKEVSDVRNAIQSERGVGALGNENISKRKRTASQ